MHSTKAVVISTVAITTALFLLILVGTANASVVGFANKGFINGADGVYWTQIGMTYPINTDSQDGDGWCIRQSGGYMQGCSQNLDLTNVKNITLWVKNYNGGGATVVMSFGTWPNSATTSFNSATWTQIKIAVPNGVTGNTTLYLYYQTGGSGGYFADNIGVEQSIQYVNATFKLHAYNGNYTTSPLIAGNYYLNGTKYTVNNTGSTYSIPKAYYSIIGQSTGYDNVSTNRDIQSNTTIDLYLLPQNTALINYDAVDSITRALVDTPTIEYYDTVTGIRTTTTTNPGAVSVYMNHTIWFNGSKTGMGNFNGTYTFYGATQIELVLGSNLTAPAGMSYVTFTCYDTYYHRLPNVNIQINGTVVTSDASGLATAIVASNNTYAYIATVTGQYPKAGSVYVGGYTRQDIVFTVRPTVTPAPSSNATVDTSVIGQYKTLVAGTVNTVVNGIDGALAVLITPVNVFNDSITGIRTGLAGAMGMGGNSTSQNVYVNLFAVIFTGLPWQVKALITYWLAWILALMFLNR